MKKTVVFTLMSLLFIAFCFILFLYLGQSTKKQYYQDGTLKSVSQRSFFKKNGEYNLYNKDGGLSQQYIFKDGVKNGPAKIYINAEKNIDMNYNNGIATIDFTSNFSGIKKLFDEFTITLYTDNSFKMNLKKIKFKSDINGKLLCKTEVFMEKVQKFFQNKTFENLKDFLSCLNIQSLNIGDNEFTCSYKGEYIYPKFQSDADFTCNGSFFDKESFKFLENVDFDASFDKKTQSLIIKTINIQNPQTYSSVSFKGLEEFLETLTEISVLHDKKLFKAKLITNLLKNLIISDSEAVVDGNKTFSTIGNFNIIKGFSNPYNIYFYTNNENTSLISITNSGANSIKLYVKNPINKKNIITSEINIGRTIIDQYVSSLENFTHEFLKNSDIDIKMIESVFATWTNHLWKTSDIINKFDLSLFNKNEDKIIDFEVNIKKNIDFATFVENIYKFIDIKIRVNKNDKHPIQKYSIRGNPLDGFIYKTDEVEKIIYLEEVINILKKSDLEQNIKEIYMDLDYLYSPIESDILSGNYLYFDPILFTIYQEIKKFFNKNIITKNIDQITNIATNIKNYFTERESFDGLNNEYAKNQNLIPIDMIDANLSEIKNASGGDVFIIASKLNNNDVLANKSYVIEFSGLSQEECVFLAINNWENICKNSGLVAIAAGKEDIKPSENGNLGTVGLKTDEALSDNVLSAKIQKDFILAMPKNNFVPTPISIYQAITACSGQEKNNAVALKCY